MRVELKENVLTVVTGIKKETVDKGIVNLAAKDDKGNEVFVIGTTNSPDKGEISSMGLLCNTVVDEELAVTIVLPMGTSEDQVKAKYGQKLVAAEKYCEKIAANAEKDMAAVDELFS